MRTVLITIAALALLAPAANASLRRPLSEEHREYTYSVMLEPTASMTWDWQCGPEPGAADFRRVWAYKWNGKPLGRLRWNRAHDLRFWRDPEHGGRAKWNGKTMTNRTSRNVLFAVWC